MSIIKDIKLDLFRLRKEFEISNVMALLANRGLHALINYRFAHFLAAKRVPILPLILTRGVQIFYGIDIDYRAFIEGGVVIIHGVGIVIGCGAVVRANTTIYHGVTLGRKGQGVKIASWDGFPEISSHCVLGAGAKIIGPVKIGMNSIIGPNCVITESLPSDCIIKISSAYLEIKTINQHKLLV